MLDSSHCPFWTLPSPEWAKNKRYYRSFSQKQKKISRQRLRQVSKSFNHFIDAEKPAVQIDELRIKVASNSVQIMLESSGHNSCLEIREHQNGALVCQGTSRPRLQENENFLDSSIEALEHVLKHRKFPIGNLKLELDNNYSEGKNSEFLEMFQKLLESDLLRVKEFHLEGHVYQALQLLPLLDPKVLKTIEFSRYGHAFEEISNNDFMQLEQWNNAKVLTARIMIFNVPIRNFAHFDIAYVIVSRITTQDLVYLRDVYTQSPKFEDATILFMNSDPLEEPFEGKKQFFRCSDPNFALFFLSCTMFVHFARVPISDVPVGAFERV
ncbi:hypothetical protein CAEBREN_02940 [Caenorhabditis brenneri]|uniref:DUF38 domain-containing protein n=1 Tax=Caenorhabditis brenneri TaxID=135651 RepID=G0NJB2_CAEBE|nr:hypothetical protein CAEBREN_02940 [Caenorhabditis brenneri]